MKYISVLFFVLLMISTWSMAHNESTESMMQHKKVEASFEDFIRTSIKNRLPNVKDIVFRQLYTETIRPDEELLAHFRYDVVSPTEAGDFTAQTVEGSVTLKSTDNGENWIIQNEQVSSPALRFQEGMRISPKDPAPESASGAAAESAPESAVEAAPVSGPTSGHETNTPAAIAAPAEKSK